MCVCVRYERERVMWPEGVQVESSPACAGMLGEFSHEDELSAVVCTCAEWSSICQPSPAHDPQQEHSSCPANTPAALPI